MMQHFYILRFKGSRRDRSSRQMGHAIDGQRIGRAPLVLDSVAIQQDRQRGQSLRQIAKGHRISTATVQRVLHKHGQNTQERGA